jgi:hypothetical protein
MIATEIPGKSALQCLHRWAKVIRPDIIKGHWTSIEDEQLRKWVDGNGAAKWSKCGALIGGRSGKQCRERWVNVLDPSVKRGEWTVEED